VPRTPFTYHEHSWFALEKLANFVGTQTPHFGDFRNGIMPLDVHRGLDLGWYGHCVAAASPGFAKIDEYLIDWLSGFRSSEEKFFLLRVPGRATIT
jgi:hypothetical protein